MIIWGTPMAVMKDMNSLAISEAKSREGRLKSPRSMSLGNSTDNPEMASSSSDKEVAMQPEGQYSINNPS